MSTEKNPVNVTVSGGKLEERAVVTGVITQALSAAGFTETELSCGDDENAKEIINQASEQFQELISSAGESEFSFGEDEDFNSCIIDIVCSEDGIVD